MSLQYRIFDPIEFDEKPTATLYGKTKLSEVVSSVFKSKGIIKLYKHQADAINLIRKGNNVVITSPTASGKTEIYLSQVVDAALNRKNSLILYPTKALARDQLKKFKEFSLYGINPKIYDGDTPDYQRKKIREDNPRILITNVDMLHHILLNNLSFSNFFKDLKYVVVDEAHSYSGVLGSHTSNIFWRLKRICKDDKIGLQFILTSATINNAESFCRNLISSPIKVVNGTSNKRAIIKHQLISQEYQNYLMTVLEYIKGLNKNTLIFGNSHSVVEKLSFFGKQYNLDIKVYRGGLNYKKRKSLEEDFKNGKIKYLATTSALELGLDIGNIDVVVLAGHPGTVTKVKQRVGRIGRKGQDALAVFIARETPLDQYYIDNPTEYLGGTTENCFINPENEGILKTHILSASRDKMLNEKEIEEFGDNEDKIRKIVKNLEKEKLLKNWNGLYSPTHNALSYISTLNLRGINDTISIYLLPKEEEEEDKNRLIDKREVSMAIGELYEGAIYLHSGRPYISKKLDLERKEAYLTPLSETEELNELTTPLMDKNITIVEQYKKEDKKTSEEDIPFSISYGKVHIINNVYGFKLKDIQSGLLLSQSTFDKPYIYEFDSYAIWIDLNNLENLISDFTFGLHAFEHIFISMIPSLIGCDSKELGGLSLPSGRVFIFESLPGGSGISEQVFLNFEKIALMSKNRINKCDCENGCPKCIFDYSCGNNNKFLNKDSAKNILNYIIDK